MITDKDKVIEYELQIEDFLDAVEERLREFNKDPHKMSDFEKGRQEAYWEVQDMIKTRWSMIHDVLEE